MVLLEIFRMPDWPTIWIFAAASFALAVTPGPDMILVAARSAAQGRMAGLMTQVGISAGTLVHALILALGLSQLFLAVPYAYDSVRYLGAAYLLFLAWQAIKAPTVPITPSNPIADTDATFSTGHSGLFGVVRSKAAC